MPLRAAHADRASRCTAARLRRVLVQACVLAFLAGCGAGDAAHAPRHYLVISHSALDRLSFFDLDRRAVVGVLPSHKLPHDMLVSGDGATLYLVNSGAQCLSTYDLSSRVLWREARSFMLRDTARTGARMNAGHDAHAATSEPMPGGASREHLGGSVAVQALPAGIARHYLTEPEFPERARAAHAQAGAEAHHACSDCHARSVGGKPFAPAFENDRHTIRLVHLGSRNLTELDTATLVPTRSIALPIPEHLAPIEAWVRPGTTTAFITCRDSIGRSLPGAVAVVDLASGALIRMLRPGIYPWHLLPSPDGRRLYVNNFQSSRIAVIDVERQQVVDSLIVENGPAFMQWHDDGRTLLVSCFYTHRLLVVDVASRTVTRRIAVGSNPTSILTTQDADAVWVLCGGESALQLVNLSSGTVTQKFPLLFGAYAMQLVSTSGTGS